MQAIIRTGFCIAALFVFAGCAQASLPLSTQLRSFGASVTISAEGSSTPRDAVVDETRTQVCISERCLHSRRRSKRPVRLQLSFYSPSVTDDVAQR